MIGSHVAPIQSLMMRRDGQNACGRVVEVHGVSSEERSLVLARLHRAFAASGCWMVRYRWPGGPCAQYSFDVELDRAMELYCGLLEAGLELSEVSHRALTELCVLRSHARVMATGHASASRVVKVRVSVGFLDIADGAAVPGGVIAALA